MFVPYAFQHCSSDCDETLVSYCAHIRKRFRSFRTIYKNLRWASCFKKCVHNSMCSLAEIYFFGDTLLHYKTCKQNSTNAEMGQRVSFYLSVMFCCCHPVVCIVLLFCRILQTGVSCERKYWNTIVNKRDSSKNGTLPWEHRNNIQKSTRLILIALHKNVGHRIYVH